MKIIDLTRTIEASMPVYPGTEQPKLEVANQIDIDGFKETLLTLYSHTGTHMDAPGHIFKEGKSLDQLPIEAFTGKGLVIDCSELEENGTIEWSYLEAKRDLLEEADFLIFQTGWEKLWGTKYYYQGLPKLSQEVLDWLTKKAYKGIGIDAISVDPVTATDLPAHHQLLGTDRMVIIENLCNLASLPSGYFQFSALPLKFKDADGAPVRAMGMFEA